MHNPFVGNLNRMFLLSSNNDIAGLKGAVKRALKLEFEREERGIFGRPRHRQDSVECINALDCEFRSSQEFKFQIRILYVPAS